MIEALRRTDQSKATFPLTSSSLPFTPSGGDSVTLDVGMATLESSMEVTSMVTLPIGAAAKRTRETVDDEQRAEVVSVVGNIITRRTHC